MNEVNLMVDFKALGEFVNGLKRISLALGVLGFAGYLTYTAITLAPDKIAEMTTPWVTMGGMILTFYFTAKSLERETPTTE